MEKPSELIRPWAEKIVQAIAHMSDDALWSMANDDQKDELIRLRVCLILTDFALSLHGVTRNASTTNTVQ